VGERCNFRTRKERKIDSERDIGDGELLNKAPRECSRVSHASKHQQPPLWTDMSSPSCLRSLRRTPDDAVLGTGRRDGETTQGRGVQSGRKGVGSGGGQRAVDCRVGFPVTD